MFDWFFHPPHKVEPYRPALNGLMIWAVANLVIVAAFLLVLPGPMWFNLGLGTSALFVAGYVRFLVPNMTNEREKPIDLNELLSPSPEATFCSDCGKQYVMRQRQNGFDPVSGKPILSYQLGCLDGDPAKPTKNYERYCSSLKYGGGLSSFRGQMYAWPNCDNPKVVPLTPVGHVSHHPGDTSTDCPKCIEQMLSDGIIDISAAKKLVRALGRVE